MKDATCLTAKKSRNVLIDVVLNEVLLERNQSHGRCYEFSRLNYRIQMAELISGSGCHPKELPPSAVDAGLAQAADGPGAQKEPHHWDPTRLPPGRLPPVSPSAERPRPELLVLALLQEISPLDLSGLAFSD